MATIGALPTIPVGIGADQDASQEYLAALTKVQKALENRNQVNLYSVAGQFFNPGRSGQFSEALGNVATTVGKEISEQQAAEPNIAMMRAQLAGQKYTMSNDAKAAGLIAQTLGVDPTDASQAVSSGNMSADQMNKLAKIYPVISQLSPTRGELIKQMFTMNKDLTEMGIKERQTVIPEIEQQIKYDPNFTYKPKPTTPVTPTVPVSSAGDQYKFANLSENDRERLTTKSASMGLINDITARSDVADLFNNMPYESRRSAFIAAGADKNTPSADQKPMTSNTQVASAQVSGRRSDEPLASFLERQKSELQSQLEIKTQKILKQNEANEKFLETIPEKMDFANNRILRGNQLIDELTGNEAAFGLLKANPGIAQAVATWFNQGLQLGRFGSLRLPVTETMESLLPKDQQQALQVVRSILNEETLQKASLLKGSVSNYEDKMVQAISGSPENTAEFLKYIGQKTKLQGEFDKKVIESYNKVSDNMLYRDWVTKSKEYGQLRGEFDKKIRESAGSTLSTMGIKPPEAMRSKADDIREEMQRRGMNRP